MISSTATAKPLPCASVNSGSPPRLARAAASSWAGSTSLRSASPAGAQPPRQRPRDHGQRDDRRRRDPERHRRLALERSRPPRPGRTGSATSTPSARARRRARSGDGRRGSRARSSSPRRPARVTTDPVERREPPNELVLDRPAQRPARPRRTATPAPAGSSPPRAGARLPVDAARVAVGDRARQQLLHRPVEHRDGDEDRRPQQRDPAVLGLRTARGWRARSRRR